MVSVGGNQKVTKKSAKNHVNNLITFSTFLVRKVQLCLRLPKFTGYSYDPIACYEVPKAIAPTPSSKRERSSRLVLDGGDRFLRSAVPGLLPQSDWAYRP
jgi:hypothetical protein